MEDLRGKVAVITGGASGIGLATARRLGEEGMRLVLADIEPAPLERAARELSTEGAEVLAVPTDVGDRDQVEALAARTYDRFGAAHVLFNNAGVAIFGGIETMRHEDWEWLIRVNLWGVIHGIESFVPRMIEQGSEGHIVNTASFAGLVPNQGLGVYCTTKYAVVGLSEVLQRDLSQHGIGVSVLCPMVVETNISSCERNRPPELGGSAESGPPEQLDEAPRPLVGGTMKAEEVAERVLEAIRDGSLYILTHEGSAPYIRRRFERIQKAFGS
jgi:NAD(P)-dependent dehydrogenase (short-subunit alcohol dehydrogenase family)